jgi:hypothetical protein
MTIEMGGDYQSRLTPIPTGETVSEAIELEANPVIDVEKPTLTQDEENALRQACNRLWAFRNKTV